MDQAQLNFPVPTQLKERIKAYAASRGISQTAACKLLLDGALTREGFPRPKELRT
jgi:hypothetical protein